MATKHGIGTLEVLDIMSTVLGLSAARLTLSYQGKDCSVLCLTAEDGEQFSFITEEKGLEIFPEFFGVWDMFSLQKDATLLAQWLEEKGVTLEHEEQPEESAPEEEATVSEILLRNLSEAFLSGETAEKAVWSAAEVNELPDSSFLYIEPGGKKDEAGKTTPRSLRHLPYKDASGEVDMPHLRNAAARVSQIKLQDGSKIPQATVDKIKKTIASLMESQSKARDMPNEAGAGYCVCEECGYQEEHTRGVPCMDRKCPECGARLIPRDVAKETEIQRFFRKVVDFGSNLLGKTSLPEKADDAQLTPGFFTIKDVDTGRQRWVGITSTAFVDKEGEIVSQTALEKSVSVGPELLGELRFWHTPGISFGTCDFRATHGLCLIESGLWRDDEAGAAAAKAVAEHPEMWGLSPGFLFNPTTLEKDVAINGAPVRSVYNDIVIVERSILPSAWAANWFTQIRATSEEKDMDPRKQEALVTLVGSAVAEQVLSEADEVNKKSLSDGAVFKSAEAIDAKVTEIAAAMKETNPDAASVLEEAAALLAEKDTAEEDGNDDQSETINEQAKEVILGLLQSLPDCEVKETLSSALEGKEKQVEEEEEDEEDKEDTDDKKKKSLDTAGDDTPEGSASDAADDNAVMKTLTAIQEQMTKLQGDVAHLQEQGNVRNIFAPGMMPSQSQSNVSKDVDPVVGSQDEDGSAPKVLKNMAEQLTQRMFTQNPGGSSNG